MAVHNNSFSSDEFVREGFPAPFELLHIMGFNKHIGVKHFLNRIEEDCFVYSMSNILSIYNLQTKQFINVLGHHECVLTYDVSANNKIMVSSDKLAVFVWDLKPAMEDTPVVLRKLENPFGGVDKFILATGISRCGKFLILETNYVITKKKKAVSLSLNMGQVLEDKTVAPSNHEHVIQFWEWAHDRTVPDEKFRLLENIGSVKNIAFSESNKNFFAITYSTIVLFGVLEKIKKNKHQMKIFIPERLKYKNLTMSCFLTDSPYLATSSKGGYVVVWTESSAKHYTNEKKHLKTIRIGYEINDIKCFDNYLVAADDRGEISFFNYDLKLMYKCASKDTGATSVLSVSPVINKRAFKLWEPNVVILPNEKDLELIPLINCPRDFTDCAKQIVIRKFFFITSTGQLYLHDPVYKTNKSYLIHSDDIHLNFDVFPIKPWILVCTKGNIVYYFNNTNEMEVSRYSFAKATKENDVFDQRLEDFDGLQISTCKISYNEEFVAIGFQNGNLCMLDPITANPLQRKLMNFSEDKIKQIHFSKENARLCCYVDSRFTIVCLQYNAEHKTWSPLGKFRYHCYPIINLFFTSLKDKNYLLTIGEDRMYVKYIITSNSLVYKRDVRLEQTAKVTAAILLKSSFLGHDTSKYKKVLLTTNNQFKIVIYDAFTADNLFTYMGPLFESPIKKILHMEPTISDPNPYLIFASDRTLGVALCPISGNQFRYSGIYVHYKNIRRVRIDHNSLNIFVLGDNDAGEYYWKLNKHNIHTKKELGGIGLEPFCKLLPGGKSGWLFKEIQDYFFYIQLISEHSDAPEKKNVNDYIKTTEIVTFMQAVGYFPSEFEIKNLTSEYIRTYGSFEAPPLLISFSKLVKLYLNHRPVDGYKFSDIKNALLFVAQPQTLFNSAAMKITLKTLLELLIDRGEAIPRLLAMKYMKELLDPKGRLLDENLTEHAVFKEFKKLPKKYDFHDFCEKLLGLPTLSKNKPNHHTISVFQGKDDPSKIVPELKNYFPLTLVPNDEDYVEIMSALSEQQETHNEAPGRRNSNDS